MARRKLIVEIVGDSRSLERSFQRSSKAASGFGRDMDRSFRGVVAGSGAFRSLGRSVAFASSAFLGGVGITAAIKSSIQAAQDQLVTQRQLAAQFQAAGVQLADYQGRIDQTVSSLQDLGIQDDEAIKAFTALFRASGNVSESLNRLQLVADIAAARHMDLQKAALLVAKVEAGNTGILRRYGVAVAKTATVQEALTAAQEKFAGQARASVTPQARFAAVLDRTQEIIGGALLPTFTKMLERLRDWLKRMNDSGELQRKVNAITRTLTDAFNGLEQAFKAANSVLRPTVDLLGGTERAVRLLIEAMVIGKVIGFASALTGIGTAAGVSATRVGLLRTSLLRLGAIGAITVLVDVVLNQPKPGEPDFRKPHGIKKWLKALNPLDANNPLLPAQEIVDFNDVNAKVKAGLAAIVAAFRRAALLSANAFAAVGNAIIQAAGARTGGGRAGRGLNLAPFRLPAALELAQAKAAATATRRDDVAVARRIKEFSQAIISSVEPLVESGKIHGARLKTLRAKLIAAYAALADANSTLSAAAEDAAAKQKQIAEDQRRKMEEAARKQREANQAMLQRVDRFRSMIAGLFEGPVLAPTEAQRRAQLGFPGSRPSVSALIADTRASTKQFLDFQRSLRTLGRRGAPRALIDQLQQLGLSAAPQAAALAAAPRGLLNQFLKAFGARERALLKAAKEPIRVYVTVNLDGRTVAANVTAHQQRTAQRSGKQRRGTQGGRALGLA